MAWRGSLSTSLISTATSSAFRSSPSISAARRLHPPLPPPRRRLTFSNPRNMGELGGAQSLMPVQMAAAGVRLTSHFSVNLGACC
ncbi:hypothetical protein ABFS82_14G105500 [Erythranthe guttata]